MREGQGTIQGGLADQPRRAARHRRTAACVLTREATDEGAAISVRGVEKRYGDKQVLRGVDFDVRYGEVLCLLGPNGAGKTTMLEILEGFRDASAGQVRVLGFDPASQSPALRERVGIVLQECGFPRHLKVAELVQAWRCYYPRPRQLDELLDVVGLQDERRVTVRKLSGGQRRRLDFALALAGDPDLIFLDEPTTGFDPEARRRCWTAIENLRSLGKTILLTTHYLDEAERLADRVAILAEGRIQAVGSPRGLAREFRVPTRISFTTPPAVARGELPPPAGFGVNAAGTGLSAAAGDPSAALRELFDWAACYGIGELEDLAVTPASLEEVYLDFFNAGEVGGV
jgi:ABC-2 type transport system ATP-binding protein